MTIRFAADSAEGEQCRRKGPVARALLPLLAYPARHTKYLVPADQLNRGRRVLTVGPELGDVIYHLKRFSRTFGEFPCSMAWNREPRTLVHLGHSADHLMCMFFVSAVRHDTSPEKAA